MVKTNEKQDALKQAAASLTVKLANMLKGRGKAQSVYRLLDENIRATITEGTFSKMVERVQKTPKEKLGDLKDAKGLTVRISRSQILVHNVLSCLGIDENEFFKEGFEALGTIIGKDDDPFHELSLRLEALESKLDYVTDCVDSEQRKSIPMRFTELRVFMDAQEFALSECVKSLDNDGNVTDGCILAYYCSIMNYVTRLHGSNKIMVRLKKISESGRNLEHPAILLVYIVTGMLIFLKLIQEFIGIYERKQRRKIAANAFERTGFLVEICENDERSDYENETLNENAEQKFMNEVRDLEIQLFQVLDSERICEMTISKDECMSICNYAREIYASSGDMFLNQEIIKSEGHKTLIKSIFSFSAWFDTGSDLAPYRLFLTNKRRKAIKDMGIWADAFFERHDEV